VGKSVVDESLSGTARFLHSLDVTSGTDVSRQSAESLRMAHKYPNILIHCVFSTKERRDLIPPEILPQLWKYFAGIGRNHGIALLAAGGIGNHSHLLIVLPSDMALAKALQILKAGLSHSMPSALDACPELTDRFS
jgi:hypothetical protein